jgi:hypothetical protein
MTAYDVASQPEELSRAFARQNDLDLSHTPVIARPNMTLRHKAVANELSTTLQSRCRQRDIACALRDHSIGLH